MSKEIVKCADCNNMLQSAICDGNRVPCPNCGSIKRKFEKSLSATVHIYPKIGIKAKKMGIGKPIKEVVFGYELYKSINKWIHKIRIIDREKNRYHEMVNDPKTGECIKECDEPLSEHIGHGSAKKKD